MFCSIYSVLLLSHQSKKQICDFWTPMYFLFLFCTWFKHKFPLWLLFIVILSLHLAWHVVQNTFVLFVSAWFVDGRYLIIIVSVGVILPLAFMKRIGTFLPHFLSFLHFVFSFYYLILFHNNYNLKQTFRHLHLCWMS